MSIPGILNKLANDLQQCENLISNSHIIDSIGNYILPSLDRHQIVVAAFLNSFKAWEHFLECLFADFLIGSSTISGAFPIKYASPQNIGAAKKMIIGSQNYFDYTHPQYFNKIVKIYFENGYPFEPHISTNQYFFDNLRTIRNACAHNSSTTQSALEAVAFKFLGTPQPHINVYSFLTSIDPNASINETIFASSKKKLLFIGEQIATG